MSMPLICLPKNTPATISAIHASGETLARMLSWGIRLNSPIKILRRGPFKGALQVQINHIDVMMPHTLIAALEVIAS